MAAAIPCPCDAPHRRRFRRTRNPASRDTKSAFGLTRKEVGDLAENPSLREALARGEKGRGNVLVVHIGTRRGGTPHPLTRPHPPATRQGVRRPRRAETPCRYSWNAAGATITPYAAPSCRKPASRRSAGAACILVGDRQSSPRAAALDHEVESRHKYHRD